MIGCSSKLLEHYAVKADMCLIDTLILADAGFDFDYNFILPKWNIGEEKNMSFKSFQVYLCSKIRALSDSST